VKKRNRLQHYEPPAVEQHRAEVRAIREAFYAQRRGEPAPIVQRAEIVEPSEPAELRASTPERAIPLSVPVPTDWRDLHWKKRVAIAKQCYPGFQFVNGTDADEAIARYLGVEP